MKFKFIKNLYLSLSVFVGIPCLFLFITILFTICMIFSNAEECYLLEKGLVYLAIGLFSSILLYMVLGFYSIFQSVIIEQSGISICFFNKTIQKFRWDNIASIQNSNNDRNPAYKIVHKNGKVMYLDKRKAIKKAIETYYSREIL